MKLLFRPFILIGNPETLFSFSEIRLIGSPQDSTLYQRLSLFHWAIALFTITFLPVLKFIIQKRNKIFKLDNLILILALATFLIFLFLPRTHKRYLYSLFPLLAIYVGLKQKFIVEYIILALCSFINVYIVWHSVKIPILTFEIISNADFQWAIAIITLVTGSVFYFKSIRTLNRT